jgi:hypothetical protein
MQSDDGNIKQTYRHGSVLADAACGRCLADNLNFRGGNLCPSKDCISIVDRDLFDSFARVGFSSTGLPPQVQSYLALILIKALPELLEEEYKESRLTKKLLKDIGDEERCLQWGADVNQGFININAPFVFSGDHDVAKSNREIVLAVTELSKQLLQVTSQQLTYNQFITSIDTTLSGLEDKITARLNEVDNRFDEQEDRFDRLEELIITGSISGKRKNTNTSDEVSKKRRRFVIIIIYL